MQISMAFCLLHSIYKKLALAPVSTSAVTSIPSTLIFVVGSISLLFSSVFVVRCPTCAAVLSSFPVAIVVQLLSCHFWVHWAVELEVQAILEHSKVSIGFQGLRMILPCCYWLLGAYPTLLALFWVWNSILMLCGPFCHNCSKFPETSWFAGYQCPLVQGLTSFY